mmetsp:Transcript_43093/g.119192  ORF Transcript_43093/g.119192 Transcript_43093/m.119192 type:complete len:316 (-) Transcript_43093:77-1024(-)
MVHRAVCMFLVIAAFLSNPMAATRLRHRAAEGHGGGSHRGGASFHRKLDCGPLTSFSNAKPKNYKDSRATRYDIKLNATVQVEFRANDTIEFECLPGYTTDGSKSGSTTFEVQCSDLGYYKPSGVCLEASKCGPVPNITHAMPTGKTTALGAVEFTCAEGYSLDGEKVVAGGLRENQLFKLKCVEFTGDYEKFEGECKPYGFIPAGETTRLYNQVFEALFVVSCKGTLKKAFGAKNGPGVDGACSKFQDIAIHSQCQDFVTKIKADFDREQAAREAHDAAAKREWHEAHAEDRPDINDEAHDFCVKLWKLLELQP